MKKYYSSEFPKMVANNSPKHTLSYGTYEVGEEEIQQKWDEMRSNSEEDFPSTPDDTFREMHRYAYYQVEIPMGQWTRDGIINAIIRDKYRQDEMEAITNNMAAITGVFFETLVTEGIVSATKYLISSIDTENSERFKEMQEWRKMAKEIASDIIKTPV